MSAPVGIADEARRWKRERAVSLPLLAVAVGSTAIALAASAIAAHARSRYGDTSLGVAATAGLLFVVAVLERRGRADLIRVLAAALACSPVTALVFFFTPFVPSLEEPTLGTGLLVTGAAGVLFFLCVAAPGLRGRWLVVLGSVSVLWAIGFVAVPRLF